MNLNDISNPHERTKAYDLAYDNSINVDLSQSEREYNTKLWQTLDYDKLRRDYAAHNYWGVLIGIQL